MAESSARPPSPSIEPPRRSAQRRASTRAHSVAPPRLQSVVPASASRRRPSATSGNAPDLFSDMAFVITMHPAGKSDGAKEKDKNQLSRDIAQHGGTVYDSWDSLYAVQGKDNISGRKDIRWIAPRRGVTTVLLLADQPTQTAKYLMALALGVPCVSSTWVKDCLAGVSLWEIIRLLLPLLTLRSAAGFQLEVLSTGRWEVRISSRRGISALRSSMVNGRGPASGRFPERSRAPSLVGSSYTLYLPQRQAEGVGGFILHPSTSCLLFLRVLTFRFSTERRSPSDPALCPNDVRHGCCISGSRQQHQERVPSYE